MSDVVTNEWFTEADLPYGKRGLRLGVEVKEVLFDERSEWGHVQVLDTYFFGKLLALDGIIQVTESEEFIYHEMMTTLPGLQHGAPRTVLIAGGGDGGALKHSLRWKTVQAATQVEIDTVVSDVCRKFLPTVSGQAFTDARTKLVYADAYEFVRDSQDVYDVMVLDLTDPVPDGPAARLFTADFLQLVAKRLAPNGIVAMQCGSLLFQPTEIQEQITHMQSIFSYTRLHNAVIPSYQLTSFGILLASQTELEELDETAFNERAAQLSTPNQFLNFEMYNATMALPPYLKRQVLPKQG